MQYGHVLLQVTKVYFLSVTRKGRFELAGARTTYISPSAGFFFISSRVHFQL